MSGSTGLLYVAAILCFFGLIFYVLMQKLLNKPVDFTKQKRIEKVVKKSSNVGGFGATAAPLSSDKAVSAGKKKNNWFLIIGGDIIQ